MTSAIICLKQHERQFLVRHCLLCKGMVRASFQLSEKVRSNRNISFSISINAKIVDVKLDNGRRQIRNGRGIGWQNIKFIGGRVDVKTYEK